jgi:hypothetical protein
VGLYMSVSVSYPSKTTPKGENPCKSKKELSAKLKNK